MTKLSQKRFLSRIFVSKEVPDAPKIMIENEYEHFEGVEAKAARKRVACLVVHALDYGVGELFPRAKIFEHKLLMTAQHPGDVLHRSETRANCPRGPRLEIGRRPGWASVLPDAAEAFLMFSGAGGGPKRGEHGLGFSLRLAAHLDATLEQQEAAALGTGLRFLVVQAGLIAAAHGVHRLVEVFGDMKGMKHVERRAAEIADDFQKRLQRVRADATQAGEELAVEAFKGLQAVAQCGFGTALSDPQQPARAAVDLINQSEEIERSLATAVVELVDPDGGDSHQVAVIETPVHDPLHGAAHSAPTGGEDFCGFLPRLPSRPAGEENHLGYGIRTLAEVTGYMLYGWRSKQRADHPPRRVAQVDRDVPERHVLPPALGQFAVDATGFATAGSTALAARIVVENHLDARVGPVEVLADGFQDEAGEVLHAAQECFNDELNGDCGVVCYFATPSSTRGRHSQASMIPTRRRFFPRKTHTGLFVQPSAAVKRTDDINTSYTHCDHSGSEFYAARPLDGGEERATNVAPSPNIVLSSTQILRKTIKSQMGTSCILNIALDKIHSRV